MVCCTEAVHALDIATALHNVGGLGLVRDGPEESLQFRLLVTSTI